MTENTKMIIRIVAKKYGLTPEQAEKEMMSALREAMASTDPHAQKLWKEIAPDGEVPDLGDFLAFASGKVNERLAEEEKPEDDDSQP